MITIKKLTSSWEKDSLEEIINSLPLLSSLKLKETPYELIHFQFFSEQRKQESVKINILKILDEIYYKPFLRIDDSFKSKEFKPTPNFWYIFSYKKDLDSFLREFIERKGWIYSKNKQLALPLNKLNSITYLNKKKQEDAYNKLEELINKNNILNKETKSENKKVLSIKNEKELYEIINKILNNYEYDYKIGKFLNKDKFEEILKKRINLKDKELIGTSLEKVFTNKEAKLFFSIKIFYKVFVKIQSKNIEIEIANENLKNDSIYYDKFDKSKGITLLSKTDFKLRNSKDLIKNVYLFELWEPNIETIKLELSKLWLYNVKNPLYSYNYTLLERTKDNKYRYKVEIEERGSD